MPFNPTHYQAIISDFDNTLTTSDSIPAEVISAIVRVSEKTIFTIATGRHRYGVIEKATKPLHLKYPIITRGGSEIHNPVTGDILWQGLIPEDYASNFMLELSSREIIFSAEIEDRMYTYNYTSQSDYSKGLKKIQYDQEICSHISKIVVRPDQKSVDEVIQLMDDQYPELHRVKSVGSSQQTHRKVIDVTYQKASKHLAGLELMQILDLDPKRVVGVGDGYNDYPLLSACGYKVATADAPDELKEIADEIIPPASENGILEILNRF